MSNNEAPSPPSDLEKVVVENPGDHEKSALPYIPSKFEEDKMLDDQEEKSPEKNTNYPSAQELIDEANLESNENVIDIENAHKTYLLGLEGVAALRGVSIKVKIT